MVKLGFRVLGFRVPLKQIEYGGIEGLGSPCEVDRKGG